MGRYLKDATTVLTSKKKVFGNKKTLEKTLRDRDLKSGKTRGYNDVPSGFCSYFYCLQKILEAQNQAQSAGLGCHK